MMWIYIWLNLVWAQDSEKPQNTLQTGFVVQGEIQRPDLTILMAKDDVTEAYELKLVEPFLPKIIESLKHYPL